MPRNVYINQYDGAKTTVVSIGELELFFSYTTLVAIRDSEGFAVSENRWSRTTARHLNAIDGGENLAKHSRLAAKDFDLAVRNTLDRHGL